MTNALRIAVTILLALTVFGCGLSREQISETVKTSMQEKFDTDPQFKDWHLTVTSVQVLKQGGNQYQGIAKINYEGTLHDVPVDITVDGNNVMWKSDPGAFMFVIQKEMDELQNFFR